MESEGDFALVQAAFTDLVKQKTFVFHSNYWKCTSTLCRVRASHTVCHSKASGHDFLNFLLY